MRRLIPFLFVVAACAPAAGDLADQPATDAGDPGVSSTESAAPSTEQQTDAGSNETPPTDSEPSEQPDTTISDRPLAPDFSLALGGGGTYTLSETEKPVYLVFWAEW